MLKQVLFILSICLIMPVFAGEYENALKGKQPVLVYMYMKDCKYCKNFDSIYDRLTQSNKTYKYIKIDAATPYGRELMRSYNARYVPYVNLLSPSEQMMMPVLPDCSINYACIEKEMKQFLHR